MTVSGSQVSVFQEDLPALGGKDIIAATSLGERTVLVVNVASHCGLTPQYQELEDLHRRYRDRGFTVLGVPCGQFAGQEFQSAEEIQGFCSSAFGVTFPMTEKLDVNGRRQHPLFRRLSPTPDPEGTAGEIQWNFEKFLVDREGQAVARFRPPTKPTDTTIVGTIEGLLH